MRAFGRRRAVFVVAIPGICLVAVLFLVRFWAAGLGGRASAVSLPASSARLPGSDGTIVVASTKSEYTGWVHEDLQDWNGVVYVVDDPTARFHTEQNKGHEANVYLTYIIANYDHLPETVVFTHAHNWAPHIGWAFHNTSDLVGHLQIENLRREGFVSLSCWNKEDCDIDRASWWNTMNNGFLQDTWSELFPDVPQPEILNAPRYGQFAVSRTQVYTRPKSHYERLHRWLMATDMDSVISGRVFEWTWHVVFGKELVLCKTEDRCLCEGFGICDLVAHRTLMYTGSKGLGIQQG